LAATSFPGPRAHLRSVPVDPEKLVEYAATNRARIEALSQEVDRMRARLHDQSAELAAMRLLIEPLRELPRAVDELRQVLDRLGRRAVARPLAATVSAGAAWVAVLIAFVTLALTVLRHT
jgi:HAMP domain-containing protein